MNCYQTMSRRLLESALAVPRRRRGPYWIKQQRLLGKNWLSAVPCGAQPRRTKSRR